MNIVVDSKHDSKKQTAYQGSMTYSRAWVNMPGSIVQKGEAQFKLITYNVLADGKKLALGPKHDYCPLNLRQWQVRFKKNKS